MIVTLDELVKSWEDGAARRRERARDAALRDRAAYHEGYADALVVCATSLTETIRRTAGDVVVWVPAGRIVGQQAPPTHCGCGAPVLALAMGVAEHESGCPATRAATV